MASGGARHPTPEHQIGTQAHSGGGFRRPQGPHKLCGSEGAPHPCMILAYPSLEVRGCPTSSLPPPRALTQPAAAPLGWLRLCLQKVFQSVSTSGNCRFTMTSTMACWGGQMLEGGRAAAWCPHPACCPECPTSQCSRYRTWKALMSPGPMPSGSTLPWRSSSEEVREAS